MALTPKESENLSAGKRADKVWFWGAAIAAGLILAAGTKQGAKSPQPVVSVTPTAKSVVRSSVPVSVPVKLAGEKFSQTRLRLLSTDEVNNLTPDQLQYAISEMYARHGLAFRKSDRRKQFRQFSWYKPVKGKTESDSERQFSHMEKRNLQLLTQIRTGRQEKRARIAQELKDAKQQEEMAEASGPVQETPPVAVAESPYYGSSGRTTYVGPRGGIYHYSASGKKVYQKRR